MENVQKPNVDNSKIIIQKDILKTITPDNIAKFAYPIVQFIHEQEPDYILACDRGARIIGIATHMLYGQLYGKLPTQDGKIHFMKISQSIPQHKVEEKLQPHINRILSQTDNPSILILDDWISSGKTQQLTRDIFKNLSQGKVNLLFEVVRGKGADISGNIHSSEIGDWQNQPKIIGVDYDDNLSPHSTKTNESTEYRRKMSAKIKEFVRFLKFKEKYNLN